ncbi:MAG: sulfite oxidase [Burkholderiales bacterium]
MKRDLLAPEPDFSRRDFLNRSSLLAMSAAIGAHIPFGRFFPAGLTPVALAQAPELASFGKNPALIVLGDKPFVAETPAHLLDADVTPLDVLFIRNNGLVPEEAKLAAESWKLTIDGESAEKPLTFSISDLKNGFKTVNQHITLECAGNGRSEFYPPAKGNKWTTGGVGFPMWTGVRLSDVLKKAGVKKDAVYIGYYGSDAHLSGDTDKPVISRGVPIARALEDGALIAWQINGQDLPVVHGYPLRLVIGGAPGSTCGKWLNRIAIRNKVHDGPKMGGHDYRLPCEPLAPGEKSDNYCILEKMPVKSLITYPQSGTEHALDKPLTVRGQAWTSAEKIKAVDVSYDFGQTWVATKLSSAKNRYGPQRFTVDLKLPSKGYYEIWAKATDSSGKSQPMVVPGWNTGGYGGNPTHRIAVQLT